MGGWTYEPDYMPTRGELFKEVTRPAADNHQTMLYSAKENALIAATYQPGTPAQTKKRLDAYLAYTVHNLPVLWMPWGTSLMEVSRSVHGSLPLLQSYHRDESAELLDRVRFVIRKRGRRPAHFRAGRLPRIKRAKILLSQSRSSESNRADAASLCAGLSGGVWLPRLSLSRRHIKNYSKDCLSNEK
ncbi:MAG: hypothetical protein OWS74_01945 [Firmicutes bacterium]|nr:hypothetical protein [Bacillota bacterium]